MTPDDRTNPGLGTPPRFPGAFVLAVREALGSLGWTLRQWSGSAVVVEDEGREHRLELGNLFRRLRRHPRERWTEQIVGCLRDVPTDPGEYSFDDLSEIADRLLLRIGPAPGPIATAPELWYHPLDGNHLGITLVVDFPASMAYVSQEQVKDSGKDGLEWLAVARGNLRGRTPADVFRPAAPEIGLLQCGVEDAYDSSRALLLDELLPEQSRHGSFVAAPGRDHLYVLPATAMALPLLPWFKTLSVKSYREVAYPISAEIYWVRGGCFRRFDISVKNGHVLVVPPPEFDELLKEWA